MKVHYQALQTCGVRAAYIAEPVKNIDAIVRAALGMESVQSKDISEINFGQEAYIIEGAGTRTYHMPNTPLQQTSCTVEVKNDGPIIVAIRSKISLPTKELETMIKKGYIDNKLVERGLIPIESSREQIPPNYLLSF